MIDCVGRPRKLEDLQKSRFLPGASEIQPPGCHGERWQRDACKMLFVSSLPSHSPGARSPLDPNWALFSQLGARSVPSLRGACRDVRGVEIHTGSRFTPQKYSVK